MSNEVRDEVWNSAPCHKLKYHTAIFAQQPFSRSVASHGRTDNKIKSWMSIVK